MSPELRSVYALRANLIYGMAPDDEIGHMFRKRSLAWFPDVWLFLYYGADLQCLDAG